MVLDSKETLKKFCISVLLAEHNLIINIFLPVLLLSVLF